MNRDLARVLYVSGHTLETSLQSENCVPIKPWKLESDDTALLDLIPFLECEFFFGPHLRLEWQLPTKIELFLGNLD